MDMNEQRETLTADRTKESAYIWSVYVDGSTERKALKYLVKDHSDKLNYITIIILNKKDSNVILGKTKLYP